MSHAPHRETTGDHAPSQSLIDRVGRILAHGGLVALPTETVYGLGVRADIASGIERLKELKGRSADRAFTWHIGTQADLDRFPEVSAMARRLVARYWPGPLTLILPGTPPGLEAAARGGWTGVRMPAQRTTAGLLAALDFPVILSSANRHGEPPLCNADDVAVAFGDGLDLLLDGGPSRLGESSSVLRLGPGCFELLREGLFDLDQLRTAAGLRIGFVCTGNTCRSPMAEGLARRMVSAALAVPEERLPEFGFEFRSMGVAAHPGDPPSKNAVAVMKEVGVDIRSHRARAAAAEDIQGFDRIYCLTRSHLDALALSLPPAGASRVELLDPRGHDIADPMGGSREVYRRASEEIRVSIQERIREWV